MNFTKFYPEYHKIHIGCDIKKNLNIQQIFVGSGGSENIILQVNDKTGFQLIIKVVPDIIYRNAKIRPNHDQLEVKFYQFFTNKYLLTDRTPHIVGIFGHWQCDGLKKFLQGILPGKKSCPTYTDKLTKKLDITIVENILCDLLLRNELKMVHSSFDMLLLEYCPINLSSLLGHFMNNINESKGKQLIIETNLFIYVLNRLFFQLIFTIAIIKDDYPGFQHGDFFLRNILVSMEEEYNKSEYVAYHYEQRIFYLEANGEYAKINDFGESIIINELEPNTLEINKPVMKYHHKNPFNKKSDVFNLFHDVYDGQNLGTISISTYAKELNISKKKMHPIYELLSRFIKIGVIDKINDTNKLLLDDTWNIDEIKILEDSVKTPHQYLTDGTFELFQKLPSNGKVIRHFNKPR